LLIKKGQKIEAGWIIGIFAVDWVDGKMKMEQGL